MPLAVIGASVIGESNRLVISCCNVMNYNPEVISFVLKRSLKINESITKSKAFSINFPNDLLLKKLSSASGSDEAGLDMPVIYGKETRVPLLVESPVNLECRLMQTIEYSNDTLYIGRVIASYSEEKYIEDSIIDVKKVDPVFVYMHDGRYWKIGDCVGQNMSLEKEFEIHKNF